MPFMGKMPMPRRLHFRTSMHLSDGFGGRSRFSASSDSGSGGRAAVPAHNEDYGRAGAREPLNSCTAEIIETMFFTGVRA